EPTMWCPSLIIGNSGTEAASEVSATSTTVPPGSVTVSASLNAPGEAEHSSTAANSVPDCFAYSATEISLVSMTTSPPAPPAPPAAARPPPPGGAAAPDDRPPPRQLERHDRVKPDRPHPVHEHRVTRAALGELHRLRPDGQRLGVRPDFHRHFRRQRHQL